MPKRRLVVGGAGLRPVQRQPAVRVRDDFDAGAARGAGSDLAQIAGALGQLSPKLAGFAGMLQDKKKAEGEAKGRARLVELAQQQEEMGEAVRLGLIEFKDNPFAQAGLLEQAGRIDGDRYGDDLRVRVGKMKDKSDIREYDRIAAEVFAEHQEAAGDPGKSDLYRQAFAVSSQAHTQQQRLQFAAGQNAEVQENALAQHYQEVFGKAEIGYKDGLSPEALGQVLTDLGNEAVLNGQNGTFVNAATIEAVATAAVELAYTDPQGAQDMLETLDHVQGKDGAPISRTRAGSSAINAAKERIAVITQRGYRFAETQAAALKREQTNEIFSAALSEMLEADDPTGVDLAPYAQRLDDAGNPTAASALLTMQNAQGQARFNSVESTYTGLQVRIWENGDVTETEVARAVEGGEVSVQDGLSLVSQIQRSRAAAAAGQGQSDPIFNNALTDIARGFKDSLGILAGKRGEQASKAEASLQWDYYQARDAGVFEGMADAERAAWLRERAAHWVQYYGGGGIMGEETEGRTTQAFIGRSDAWERNVVVTKTQLNSLVERFRTRSLTEGDLDLLRRLGVPPGTEAEFIRSQQTLIKQTVLVSEDVEGAESQFSESLTEG